MQTSTVTVLATEIHPEAKLQLRDQDIKIFTTTAGGPGGQHQNKTQSAVIMRHLPTGIEAQASERCQHQNKRLARAVLEARVIEFLSSKQALEKNLDRKARIGSGQRADKIRTYRQQDDLIIDHRTGVKRRLSSILKGGLAELLG